MTETTSVIATEASIQHLRLSERELQREITAALQILFSSGEWRASGARTFTQYLMRRFEYSIAVATEIGKQVGAVLGSEQLRDSNPEIQARIDSLRVWRRQEARSQGQAAYRVISNRELLEIARANPTSLRALREIAGIGPKKIENFGEKILGHLHPRARTYPDTDPLVSALASTLY